MFWYRVLNRSVKLLGLIVTMLSSFVWSFSPSPSNREFESLVTKIIFIVKQVKKVTFQMRSNAIIGTNAAVTTGINHLLNTIVRTFQKYRKKIIVFSIFVMDFKRYCLSWLNQHINQNQYVVWRHLTMNIRPKDHHTVIID